MSMDEPQLENDQRITTSTRDTNFWAELRRRRVTRVAITYAVVAWLLIQVTSVVFPQFDIPTWAERLVTLVLFIGFPIVLIITWAFEITPEGIKTTKSAREERGSQPVSDKLQKRKNRTSLLFAAGLPTLLFGSLAIFFFFKSGADGISGLEDKSIAVLPFTAFSADEEEQFFADGLSDTLLHKLAQLSELRVISRSSSFQYRGDSVDVRKVGEELNVATVLEGSVQRSGARLRIIAQLINTEDGGHIWSKTFDSSSEDTFAIQDEIAESVVDSLSISASADEQARLASTGTESVEAYNLLTLVKERSNAVPIFELSPEEYQKRKYLWLDELDRVLEIDPDYANVYRAKGGIYSHLAFRSPLNRERHLEEGTEAILTAMTLEPDNPENFVTYADLLRRRGDARTAEVFARMALNRLPNSVGALVVLQLSLVAQSKNPQEQYDLVQREKALAPSNSFTHRREAFSLQALGRYEEAVDVLKAQIFEAGEVQVLAQDLTRMLSSVLGRHVENMGVLIDARALIKDSANDIFYDAWLTVARAAGVSEEFDKLSPMISDPVKRAYFEAAQLVEEGQEEEVAEFVASKASASNNSWLFLVYVHQREYQESIEAVIAALPHLEPGKSKAVGVNNIWELFHALPLALSYQRLGEKEAADQLTLAIGKNIDDRRSGGTRRLPGYLLPAYHLLKGDAGEAMRLIEANVYLEGDNYVPLVFSYGFDSPIFDQLRDLPEFKTAVAEYQRRKAASAASIRGMIQAAGY